MTLLHKLADPRDFFIELQRALDAKLGPYLEPANLATVASLAFIYYFVGKIGLHSATPNHSVTAIWLPARCV